MNKQKLQWIYASHQALHWLIKGIGTPVLILIFQSRGLNLQEVGFVMAMWCATTAMLEVPLGGVADKYGRKKTYLVSLLINIMGLMALSFSAGLEHLLVAAFLLGAARAVYSGTLDAWFYDYFQRAQGTLTYHTAMSKVSFMITLGLASGSLIGGLLPSIAPDISLGFESIYDLNIIVIGLGNVFLFAVTFVMIEEKNYRQNKLAGSVEKSILRHSLEVVKDSMSHEVLKRLVQTTLVFGVVMGSVETYWQPYLSGIIESPQKGAVIFGVVTALYFLMSSASSLLSVPLLKFFDGSHKTLLFVSRGLAGLVLLALAMSDDIYSFMACYLVFFFLFTIGHNSSSVLLNDNTHESRRSTMISVVSFIATSGAVLSTLLLGYVSEYFSISMNWIICGVVLAVSSVLFVYIPVRKVVEA